jgi:phage shock protein A
VLVEANLFSRLVRVVKAYVSNFTEQFEDPEVMLDRVTDEMQEDLIKMRQATAKVRVRDAATLHARLLCCCMMLLVLRGWQLHAWRMLQ